MNRPKFPQLEALETHELVACFLITFATMLSFYTIFPRATHFVFADDVSTLTAEKINPYQTITLSAKAAYVYDLSQNRPLYSSNADEPLALASLTKVMTALTAIELIPAYTVVTIGNDDLAEEGDSGLFGDERWKLKDLLDYSLVVSSNDGARAVASVAGSVDLGTEKSQLGREGFIARMNEKAKEIGLLETHFSNENGLDVAEVSGGAYGSARDMAKLFGYIIENHPELLEATRYDTLTFTSLSNLVHEAKNTNTKIGEIPGLVASKTGFTDLSGGNLVIIFNPEVNHPIAVVVLGSTYDGRFDDVLSLVKATFQAIAQK